MKLRSWIVALLCLPIATIAFGVQPDLPKVAGVVVRGMATKDESSGIYTYSFRLDSSPAATLPISDFTLDLRSDASRVELPGGLTMAPLVLPTARDHLLALGPAKVVPVGLPSVPSHWVTSVDAAGFARWGAGEIPLAIGSQDSGFVVTSYGLPGIRTAQLEADLFDSLPNADDPESGVTTEELVAALKESALQLPTVGPIAPPKDSTPASLVAAIAALRIRAAELGWIRTGTGVTQMDALLGQVQTAIAQNALGTARQKADAFIAQVNAISCSGFDCPATTPLTSEARALLAFNMQYLRDQLPPPATTVVAANADSVLRPGNKNTNEGSNPTLALAESGPGLRIVVGFDLTGVDRGAVKNARVTLQLRPDFSPSNWGQSGGSVAAHPLTQNWSEGNARELYLAPADRAPGSGPGVTWNCAADAQISNQSADCNNPWNGGSFAAASDSVLHTNGMSGEVSWDVTADVQNGASSWLIERSGGGSARYYSREGATAAGDAALGPRLVIE